jgi:hypothetical protein
MSLFKSCSLVLQFPSSPAQDSPIRTFGYISPYLDTLETRKRWNEASLEKSPETAKSTVKGTTPTPCDLRDTSHAPCVRVGTSFILLQCHTHTFDSEEVPETESSDDQSLHDDDHEGAISEGGSASEAEECNESGNEYDGKGCVVQNSDQTLIFS